MAVDGLTPPPDEVADACRLLRVPVHVLIRPRAGDFVYDDEQYEAARRAVESVKALGAAGVVIGVNTADGAVDGERTAALVALARPMSVTFHKAFDVLRDPFEGLESLATLGDDRVLTSGGAATAVEGLSLLARLVRAVAGRVVVMAGGRVREEDVPGLRGAGLTELHVGSSVMTDGATDAAKVRRFVEAVRRVDA